MPCTRFKPFQPVMAFCDIAVTSVCEGVNPCLGDHRTAGVIPYPWEAILALAGSFSIEMSKPRTPPGGGLLSSITNRQSLKTAALMIGERIAGLSFLVT